MRDIPQIRLTTEKKIIPRLVTAEFDPGSQKAMRAWSRDMGRGPGGELTCCKSQLDAWTVPVSDLGQAVKGLPLERPFTLSSHEHHPSGEAHTSRFLGTNSSVPG